MKNLALALLAFISFLTANALPTLIQGNAFSYRGQSVEIRQYSELFTYTSDQLAQQYIPENGNFKFQIDIKNPGVFLVKIGKIHAHLFVMPGDEYTMVIPEPYEEDRFGPARDIFVLPEIFESKYKLNYEITKIEQELNQFVIDHTYMYKSGGVNRAIRKPADSLIVALNERYQNSGNQYLKDHLHFRLAEFEIMIGKGNKFVYEHYLKNQKPRYDLLSYSNTIDNFYRKALFPGTTNQYSDDVELAFKQGKFSKIDEGLKTDSTLQNDELRHLVIAYQLYQLGASRTYDRLLINNLLDSVKLSSKSQNIKIIAQNTQDIIMYLAPGSQAPDFKFSDVVGNIYRLKDYEGTLIYIQFFDKFTPDVLREMSLMKVLKEGYGADVAFYSISLSETNSRLKKLSEEHDFDWFFARATNADGLRELYELRSLPAYYFVDEELNFLLSPAPSPGAEIEIAMANEYKKNHPNTQLLFKLQPPEVTDEKPIVPEGVQIENR